MDVEADETPILFSKGVFPASVVARYELTKDPALSLFAGAFSAYQTNLTIIDNLAFINNSANGYGGRHSMTRPEVLKGGVG